MLWIDTPMVREGKADSEAFREMLRNCPGRWQDRIDQRCGEIFVTASKAASVRSTVHASSVYCGG